MAKVKIMLDIGHGGTDPGAIGNGVRESDACLQAGLAARKELQRILPMAEVRLSRDKDISLSRSKRLSTIQRYNPDICVSIHQNSASNTSARGVECFHSHHDKRDDMLAKLIVDKIAATGVPSRGVKTKTTTSGVDYFYMIREVADRDTISVLVEGGFVSNPTDARLMKSGWLTKQGKAIAQAIAEYARQTMDLGPSVRIKKTGQVFEGVIIDNRMYTPVRAPFEALGHDVYFNSKTKEAIVE